MSLETEVKKVQAAIVQLTDAIVSIGERMSAAPAAPISLENTFKEAEPFPLIATEETVGERADSPAPTIVATTTTAAPAMPGTLVVPGTGAKQKTGQVPSTVYNQAPQPAQPEKTDPIPLAEFGQKLGALAVKMGDNGTQVRALTTKFKVTHISQIPEDQRNKFLDEANKLAGGGA